MDGIEHGQMSTLFLKHPCAVNNAISSYGSSDGFLQCSLTEGLYVRAIGDNGFGDLDSQKGDANVSQLRTAAQNAE